MERNLIKQVFCLNPVTFSAFTWVFLRWKTSQLLHAVWSVVFLYQQWFRPSPSAELSEVYIYIYRTRWKRHQANYLLFLSMPFIQVSSPTGSIKFHYTISTPKCNNADELDPDCPVLLFFHAFGFPEGFQCMLFLTLNSLRLITYLLQYQLSLLIRYWESSTSLFLTSDGTGTQKATEFHSLTDKKKQQKM